MSRIDRSVLPLVTGHLAGRAGAPPAAHIEASAGRAVAAAFPHPQGRPGGQGAVSARGRGCVHSPPPFPLRPRPAGPTLFPPFSCPAVLWLLGQEREFCAADRGTGGLPQGLSSACSYLLRIGRRPLLGWTDKPSTSQTTQSVVLARSAAELGD